MITWRPGGKPNKTDLHIHSVFHFKGKYILKSGCFRLLLPWVFLLFAVFSYAHPMPNSVVGLSITDGGVKMDLKLPLSELLLAMPNLSWTNSMEQFNLDLSGYLLSHVRAKTPDGRDWYVELTHLDLNNLTVSQGAYRELRAQLWLQPPEHAKVREFELYYDVIIHQVVTHSAFLVVMQDWKNGITSDQEEVLGIVQVDVSTATVPPIRIDLGGGSNWKGFTKMVQLGMHHIRVGTDHLLFLLVLLLPASLLSSGGKWTEYGGLNYTLKRLLKIITAFTIGHSFTLAIGAQGWFRLPGQPVEILIAFSILISAIHAIRPLFPKGEVYIAAGFGLIHGLAFAEILSNLHFELNKFILSLLGFNIGIELMQLIVVIMVVPSLILINYTKLYPYVRTLGAIFGGLASIGWILERIQGNANIIGDWMEIITQYPMFLVGGFFIFSILTFVIQRNFSTTSPTEK